ncbi:MAG: ThuA domain-containing protein [Gammaproteobacteria bacterium]|nr:ThuA domain-containing protein [Gammaproteobacteria bacterium]
MLCRTIPASNCLFGKFFSVLCALLLVGSHCHVVAAESVVIPVPDYRPPETVQAVAVPAVPNASAINVLIISGQSSYEHDWTGVNTRLRSLMLDSGVFDVRIIEDPRTITLALLKRYDVVFVNYLGRWNYSDKEENRWGREPEQALFDYADTGGGVVIYHASLNMGAPSWPAFERLAGGTMRPLHGSRRSPPDAFMVKIVDHEHPVTQGMREYVWTMNDDMYTNMYWDPQARVRVLATAYDDPSLYTAAIAGPKYPPHLYTPEKLASMSAMAADNPQVWTVEYGSGRVFCVALGHGPDTLLHDGVKSLLLRGTEWAATGNVTVPVGPKAQAFTE